MLGLRITTTYLDNIGMMPTPVTRTSLVSKDGDAAAKPDAGVGTLSIRSLSGEGGAGGGAMPFLKPGIFLGDLLGFTGRCTRKKLYNTHIVHIQTHFNI